MGRPAEQDLSPSRVPAARARQAYGRRSRRPPLGAWPDIAALFTEVDNEPACNFYEQLGGERQLNERGEFGGMYGWPISRSSKMNSRGSLETFYCLHRIVRAHCVPDPGPAHRSRRRLQRHKRQRRLGSQRTARCPASSSPISWMSSPLMRLADIGFRRREDHCLSCRCRPTGRLSVHGGTR